MKLANYGQANDTLVIVDIKQYWRTTPELESIKRHSQQILSFFKEVRKTPLKEISEDNTVFQDIINVQKLLDMNKLIVKLIPVPKVLKLNKLFPDDLKDLDCLKD